MSTQPRVRKGLVDVGAALVAHAQTTKAVKPSQGAFDHPAVTTKTLAALLPAPGDAGEDAACPQRRPAASVVVVLVGVQLFGRRRGRPLGPAMGSTAARVCSSILESCTLAAESTAAKGRPPRSTTRWRFVPARPRSTGFGPVSRPLWRGHRAGVHGGPAPIQPSGVGQALEQGLVQQVPHTGLVPVAQPSPARQARAAAHLRWQQLPGRAGPQHEDDAGEHHPVPAGVAVHHAGAARRAAATARLPSTTRHLPAAWPCAQPTRKPGFVRCSKETCPNKRNSISLGTWQSRHVLPTR